MYYVQFPQQRSSAPMGNSFVVHNIQDVERLLCKDSLGAHEPARPRDENDEDDEELGCGNTFIFQIKYFPP